VTLICGVIVLWIGVVIETGINKPDAKLVPDSDSEEEFCFGNSLLDEACNARVQSGSSVGLKGRYGSELCPEVTISDE